MIRKIILAFFFLFASSGLFRMQSEAIAQGMGYNVQDKDFKVVFPEKPKKTTINTKEWTNESYQLTTLQSGHVVQYNIYHYDFKEKILGKKSIDAYLAKAHEGIGTLLKNKRGLFSGLPATEFAAKLRYEGLDFIRRGLVVFVDGDAIKITVLEPAEIPESKSYFLPFKQSLRFLPVNLPLTETLWSNKDIAFYPPSGWDQRDAKKYPPNIAVFANKSGISLELMRASSKEVSCHDMLQLAGHQHVDEKGNLKTEFKIEGTEILMNTVSKCLENNESVYLLTGKGPKSTFFRWEDSFLKVLDTFTKYQNSSHQF
ncbi:MAG: hypothetical protein AB7S81_07515 [Bdellovibrionales bacterium]